MNTSWKKRVVILAGAASVALVSAAHAHWPSTRVDVEIFDRTEGRSLPIYMHEGRRYVVGKPGNEYAIRLRNNGGERVLAVMSVDGVNVISGDTASPAQSGYVLAPNISFDIAGWRKSLSRTAAFYFTSLPDSYAALTGRPDNIGVIGVAVFRERPRAMPQLGGYLNKDSAREETEHAASAATPAPGAAGMIKRQAEDKLGTGHGRAETSYAQYTDFERASETPNETIAIYYDSYKNLLAQGVPVGQTSIARNRPEPFPERGRFAPDPR